MYVYRKSSLKNLDFLSWASQGDCKHLWHQILSKLLTLALNFMSKQIVKKELKKK